MLYERVAPDIWLVYFRTTATCPQPVGMEEWYEKVALVFARDRIRVPFFRIDSVWGMKVWYASVGAFIFVVKTSTSDARHSFAPTGCVYERVLPIRKSASTKE